MNEPEAAIVELWEVMKSYIVPKERKVAAEQYLTTVLDLGLVSDISDEMFGICDIFDKVMTAHKREHDEPTDLFDQDE
jgi:hypothetical protein